MKNLIKNLSLIAIIAISLSSCKKTPQIDALLGTWTLEGKPEVKITSPHMLAAALQQFINSTNELDNYAELPKTLILNADGTGKGIRSEDELDFEYTKTDSQLILKEMGWYIGAWNEDLVIDYQLLDKDKTINISIDITTTGKWLLKNMANNYDLPWVDIDDLIATITKIEVTATYKK